ncbi:MAG: hypothetical protein AAFY65_04415 [Pseudomonadota bacterium]
MTPIKLIAILGAVLTLSACGGGTRGSDVSLNRNFATGPIYSACLRADRRAADRSLCGCVQASADATLSGGEQSRAVRFFRDPHRAQEIRQSDRASDERFWQRYKKFVAAAERSCA